MTLGHLLYKLERQLAYLKRTSDSSELRATLSAAAWAAVPTQFALKVGCCEIGINITEHK